MKTIGQTPKEFKAWATKHSNLIKKALKAYGFTGFGKLLRGHFDYSFFAYSESAGWVYVSRGDVRGSFGGDQVLIRTAEHEKDYMGGRNHFISLNERFEDGLRSFIKMNGGDIPQQEEISHQKPRRGRSRESIGVQKTLFDFMVA